MGMYLENPTRIPTGKAVPYEGNRSGASSIEQLHHLGSQKVRSPSSE